jgi:hypothetical protein
VATSDRAARPPARRADHDTADPEEELGQHLAQGVVAKAGPGRALQGRRFPGQPPPRFGVHDDQKMSNLRAKTPALESGSHRGDRRERQRPPGAPGKKRHDVCHLLASNPTSALLGAHHSTKSNTDGGIFSTVRCFSLPEGFGGF